jgi:hypothetical protein
LTKVIYEKKLLHKTVSVGYLISLFEIGDGFESFFNSGMRSPEIKVLETHPSGEVKITKNTIIKQLDRSLNEDGLPKSKIINVRNLPDLKELFEVDSLNEISKITNAGNFINRFEDENKIIYLVNAYYYIKKK